jgi:hypothetical protein
VSIVLTQSCIHAQIANTPGGRCSGNCYAPAMVFDRRFGGIEIYAVNCIIEPSGDDQ